MGMSKYDELSAIAEILENLEAIEAEVAVILLGLFQGEPVPVQTEDLNASLQRRTLY
jgi:hypothetical protein